MRTGAHETLQPTVQHVLRLLMLRLRDQCILRETLGSGDDGSSARLRSLFPSVSLYI